MGLFRNSANMIIQLRLLNLGQHGKLLTYLYLPAFNLWLMLCPSTLSYDWQTSSIPLVESFWELRNLASLAYLLGLFALVVTAFRLQIEVDFVDQIARNKSTRRVSERGIRISNRFPNISGTLSEDAERLHFRHTMAGTFLKTIGVRKLDHWGISRRAI
ncbi:transmembrane and TPR repeat-containing protein 1 [Trichonephila clavipes]|nr:transmembrane and TPR repeat-containing protein 1 [Trichonephila clavipes]